MIGFDVTADKDGNPIVGAKKLSKSSYQPETEIVGLLARAQNNYQTAWRLQHHSFPEFDGVDLLTRAKRDQETFSAFVGAEFIPQHKRWRWNGRKNTARNKIIGLLAHMLSAMLFPTVHAQNPENEEDKTTARIMRIRVESHLRKAGYKTKFLYMVLSALVNPAVFVEVDYLVAYQRIKEQLANNEVKITDAVDTILSGLSLDIVPVDQLLLADFYIHDIQKQPFLVRINRISYDSARKIYGKRFYVDGKDQFDYVEAGKTRIVTAGQEGATLFDVEWTEADQGAVQVLTFMYRDEDLEFDVVGGVFLGNTKNPYNTNPFKHRRMSLVGDEWKMIPIYKYAKSGFEPLDPSGRFAYYKSAGAKLYWDDATQNRIHQMLVDATALDTIKPLIGTGIMKVDSTVIAPGAYITTPNAGASLTPWSSNPNIKAAFDVLTKQESDQSDSTQDPIMNGNTTPNVTATASIQAQNQARVFLGVFGVMVADLIQQVGELVMDCIIQHETLSEIDATIPEALALKERTFISRNREHGKDMTHRIVFTDAFMGKNFTPEKKKEYEWKLWEQAGGEDRDQEIHHVNPYRFARTQFSFYLDPDDITAHAMGNDRQRKELAFQKFTNPVVSPYVDMQKVIEDFVIDEYAEGDPDRYKSKMGAQEIMSQIASSQGQPSAPKQPGQAVGQPAA